MCPDHVLEKWSCWTGSSWVADTDASFQISNCNCGGTVLIICSKIIWLDENYLNCEGNLYGDSGVLSGAGEGECQWVISSTSGKGITISFSSFSVWKVMECYIF